MVYRQIIEFIPAISINQMIGSVDSVGVVVYFKYK